MRTALQQAFARLEELHPSLFDIHTEKGRTFVNEFSKFLEVEKEQTIKACKESIKTCGMGHIFIEYPEQYYNETFKSE
jgi:ferredoxin